jgi:hypothetical protein
MHVSVGSFAQVEVPAENMKINNQLLLHFSPAENVAKDLEKEHGKVSVFSRALRETADLTFQSPHLRFEPGPVTWETHLVYTYERCKLAGDGTGEWN